MKQRLTTLLLAVLVLSSLVLTYQLWYGRHRYDPVDQEVPERVFFEAPRSLADIITPERIIVETGNGCHLLRHGQECFTLVWDEFSRALQDLAGYDYRATESLEDARSVMKIIFDPLLPVGAGTPWLGNDRYREISMIELWSYEDESWAVLHEPRGGEMALRLSGLPAAAIQGMIPEGLPDYGLLTPDLPGSLSAGRLALEGELYVPLSPVVIPEFNLQKEYLDWDRLVDAFFVDRGLVRKIQEKGGAVIYTDGTKGLRIKQGVGFSDPVQEKSFVAISYLSALSACSKYVCSYGGWPEELRLQKLSIDNKGRYPLYQAYLKYYREGLPLVGANQALSLVFGGSGLVEYFRIVHLFQPSGNEVCEISSYSQAIEESVNVYCRQYGETEPLVLEEIDLVYAETGPSYQLVAVPAWLVQINGKRIMLHAGELSLLEGGGS